MSNQYEHYDINWKDIIRPYVLKRDNYTCQHCKLKNRTIFVMEHGERVIIDDSWLHSHYIKKGVKISKVVLQIAHLDHNVSNNDYSNLLTLCTRCHLRYDSASHAWKRRINLSLK